MRKGGGSLRRPFCYPYAVFFTAPLFITMIVM